MPALGVILQSGPAGRKLAARSRPQRGFRKAVDRMWGDLAEEEKIDREL